jgi:hypothetical protein
MPLPAALWCWSLGTHILIFSYVLCSTGKWNLDIVMESRNQHRGRLWSGWHSAPAPLWRLSLDTHVFSYIDATSKQYAGFRIQRPACQNLALARVNDAHLSLLKHFLSGRRQKWVSLRPCAGTFPSTCWRQICIIWLHKYSAHLFREYDHISVAATQNVESRLTKSTWNKVRLDSTRLCPSKSLEVDPSWWSRNFLDVYFWGS